MSNAHKYATRNEGVKSRARRPRVGACMRARACVLYHTRDRTIGLGWEKREGREISALARLLVLGRNETHAARERFRLDALKRLMINVNAIDSDATVT